MAQDRDDRDDVIGSPSGWRPRLSLSGFLPYRLNVMAAVVSEGLARIYGERFGIGIPEWRILATVGECGAITATALGLHAHMGKVKVSRAASALEARGFVERRQNPDDMREAFLALTPEGQEVYGRIIPLALDYVERLTQELSPEEARALDLLIGKLIARAGRMNGEAAR